MTGREASAKIGEGAHLLQLYAFNAIAETRSIAQAAELLGATQPSVSRLLLRLERKFGVPLFVRHNRGVSLTAAGAALLPAAQKVLEAAAGLERAAVEVKGGVSGVLRLGTTEGATPLLRSALHNFRRRRPGAEVLLHSAHTPAKLMMLERRELDVAFVRAPMRHPDLCFLEVAKEPLLAVLANDHPLASQESVYLSELSKFPLLLTAPDANNGVHNAVLAEFDRAGMSPRLGAPLMNELDGMAHVAASNQWTLLSRASSPGAETGLVFREIADAEFFGVITLAWHVRPGTPLVSDFVESARSVSAPRA